MFSFIARRAAVRLPLLAGSRLPTRTLFTTSRLLIASTDNVSPATAKSTSKATTEPTTKAKKPRKVSEKKPAPKKKKVVRKKPVLPKRVQVTKDMLPPKRPSSAYMMFYTSLLSHRPRIADKSDIAASGISGGKAWHALSEEEKQLYHDQYKEAFAQWRKEMDAWKEQVDPKVLTEINRKKKAKGKPRIVRHGTGSPANAWVRFTKDMAIEYPSSTTPEGQKYIHWLASRTKERWDQLSDAEKKPYVDEHKRELAAWRANRDAGKNA